MNFREHFDIPKDLLYLNSGTLAFCPVIVKKALQKYRDESEQNPAQSLFDAWGKMWSTQKNLAQFVKAKPEDIFIRSNVTIAMNDFIQGISLPENSEILTTDMEYGAIVSQLKHRALTSKLTLKVAEIPLKPQSSDELLETLAKAITPKTSMIMVSHVMTGNGLKFPIEKLRAAIKRDDIILCVDGAHGMGLTPLDFSNLDIDSYSTNLHKWMMGPKGTGFCWVNPRVQSKMNVIQAGWTTFETPIPFEPFATPQSWATRFMISSSHDFSTFYAINDTLEFWNKHGAQKIQNELQLKSQELRKTLKSKLDWPLLSDFAPEFQTNLIAISLPPHLESQNFKLMNQLRETHKLQVAITKIKGKWCLRLTPQIYNTSDEFIAAAKILETL